MAAHGQQQTPSNPNDEGLTTAEEQQQAYQESVPEGTQFLEILAAFGLVWASHRANVSLAIQTLQDKKLVDYLLKHPAKAEKIRAAYKMVQKEHASRRNKNKKDNDKITVGNGRFKRSITIDVLERTGQVIKVADAVDNKINTLALKGKMETTINRFGLNPDNAQQLRGGLKDWLKKNPGRSPEEYLIIQGRHLYLSERVRGENLSESAKNSQIKKLEKKYKKELKGINEQLLGKEETVGHWFRKKTVSSVTGEFNNINDVVRTQNADLIIREQQAFAHIKNPKRTRLTDEQVNQEVVFVIQGTPTTPPAMVTKQEPPSTPTQPSPIPSPVPAVPPSPTFMPQTPSPQAAAPAPAPSPATPSRLFGGGFGGIRNSLGSRFGGVGNFFGGLGGKLGGLLGGGGGNPLGGLAGLGNAAKSLANGAKNLANGLSGIAKNALGLINPLNKLKWGVIIVGGIIIFIIFIIISSGPPPFTNMTADNALPLSQLRDTETRMVWSEFNDVYLTLGKNIGVYNEYSWNQFDNEFLGGGKNNLALDANRHDDVQE